jgi:hypothetical protein
LQISDIGGLSTSPAAGGNAVFNEGGVDADFRVESDGNTHMLFVDAGNDRVGVGVSSPQANLQVLGTLKVATGNDLGILGLGEASGTTVNAGIFRGAANNPTSGGNFLNLGGYDGIVFAASAAAIGSQTERMRINSGGNVLIGRSSDPYADGNNVRLHVEGALPATDGRGQVAIATTAAYNATDRKAMLNFSGAFDTSGTPTFLAGVAGEKENTTNNNYGGALTFHTRPNGGNFAERMRIDSAGKVAMGTSSADADASVLSIKGTDPAEIYDGQILIHGSATSGAANTGAGIGFKGHHGTGNRNLGAIQCLKENGTSGNIDTYMRFVTRSNSGGLAEAMRIDSSGNVGIGSVASGTSTATPVELNLGSTFANSVGSLSKAKFKLFEDSSANVYGLSVSSGFFEFGVPSSAGYTFFINESEKMRLDANGNLGIGVTSVDAKFKVQAASGNTTFNCFNAGSGSQTYIAFNVSGGGTSTGSITTNGSTTAYNTSSDVRLKDNILDAPSASDDIDAIQVRSFDWRADGSHQKYGMVAQELNTVAPEAVSAPEDPDEMMGVDYSKLVPMLVKEIQSLRARVAQLETEEAT